MATSSAGVAESRSGPRNRAVRWKEPSLLRMTPFADQRRPGQEIGEALAAAAVFGEVHHGAASRDQMLRVAQVPAHDIDEGGIALGGPDGGQMADQPDGTADDPEPQAQARRRRRACR